jgi:endo-1,4-beta-mannosidase
MSFKIRLEELLKHYSINPKKLSESLGYESPAKLYRLLKYESNNPSVQILQDIMRVYPEINPGWLLIGKGEMLQSNSKKDNCKGCKNRDFIIEQNQKLIIEQRLLIDQLNGLVKK